MLKITENEILEAYDAFELTESELIELYSEGYISENTMDQLIEMGAFDELLDESAAGDAVQYDRQRKRMLSRLANPDLLKRKGDIVKSRLKAGLPISLKGISRGRAIARHIASNPSAAKQAHDDYKRAIRAGLKLNYRG